MKYDVRLRRLELAGHTQHEIAALYARLDLSPDVDPATITDPAQRAGLTMLRSLTRRPGGAAQLRQYLDALAAFGREQILP